MRSTTLRVAAAAVAVGGFTAYVSTSHFLFFVPVIFALLLLATSFSEASRLAEGTQGFVHHTAEVRVWGVALPVPEHSTIKVTSVKALSAGLHLFFQVSPSGSSNGSSTHLKVAQPSGALVLPRRLTIESAAYVQWAGKRLPRVGGGPALTVSLDPSPSSERPKSVA